MAMVILGNAVAFHRSIADLPGVPALSPGRPVAALPLHHEVVECWTIILRDSRSGRGWGGYGPADANRRAWTVRQVEREKASAPIG